MQQWKYRQETVGLKKLELRLNELGKDGWELVSVSWGTMCEVVLKRRYDSFAEEMFGLGQTR